METLQGVGLKGKQLFWHGELRAQLLPSQQKLMPLFDDFSMA